MSTSGGDDHGQQSWREHGRAYGFARDGSALIAGEVAEIVAAAQALLSGISLPGIAEDMRRRGVRTVAGARWTAVGVGRMLCRARNAGLAQHRGFITGPAAWPAVLAVPTWRAVLGRVHDPGRTLLSPLAAECLGAGLYECHCGAAARVFVTSAAPCAYYTCRAGKHWTRPAQPVDALVGQALTERLAARTTLPRLRRAASAAPAGGAADIDTAIASAQHEASAWIDRYVAGKVSAEELAAHTTGLHHHVGRLRTGIADPASAVARLLLAADPVCGWHTLSHADQRALIHVMCRVRVLPATQGRRHGWTPGESYMDPASIDITWQL